MALMRIIASKIMRRGRGEMSLYFWTIAGRLFEGSELAITWKLYIDPCVSLWI